MSTSITEGPRLRPRLTSSLYVSDFLKISLLIVAKFLFGELCSTFYGGPPSEVIYVGTLKPLAAKGDKDVDSSESIRKFAVSDIQLNRSVCRFCKNWSKKYF